MFYLYLNKYTAWISCL